MPIFMSTGHVFEDHAQLAASDEFHPLSDTPQEQPSVFDRMKNQGVPEVPSTENNAPTGLLEAPGPLLMEQDTSEKPKKISDIFGKGSDLQGPYIPNAGWNKLSEEERQKLEENSANVFGNDFNTAEDLANLIDKHGSVQVYPYNVPAAEEFLRRADPNIIERFNYLDREDKTIFLRRKAVPTS